MHVSGDQLPQAFVGGAVRYETSEKREQFKQKCGEIGTQLLKHTGESERNQEWVEQRKLGYGNAAYLVVFPYNTPTQTLTLLWSKGKVNGWDWLPLLPRRPKR